MREPWQRQYVNRERTYLLERRRAQSQPPASGRKSIQQMVRDDLAERERLGIERYGTALYPNNGRSGLRDLYEELLDAVFYVRQLIEESKGNGG